MVILLFQKRFQMYNAGETAGFSVEEAKRIVARGVATYTTPVVEDTPPDAGGDDTSTGTDTPPDAGGGDDTPTKKQKGK